MRKAILANVKALRGYELFISLINTIPRLQTAAVESRRMSTFHGKPASQN